MSVVKLNPAIMSDKRDAMATAWNEGLRLWIEDNGFEPQFEFTPEQQTFFMKTAYSQDAAAMRKTIVARIATRDNSIPRPSGPQISETMRLLQEVGDSIGKFHKDAGTVKALMQDLQTRAPAPVEQEAVEAPVTEGTEQMAQGAGDANTVPTVSSPIPPPPPPDMPEGRAPQAPQPLSVKPRALNLLEGADPKMDAVVNKVLDALVVAEGNAADDAVGDTGRAVGKYQTWPISVEEANRIVGRDIWKLEDRKDPTLSRAMAKTIIGYHYRLGVKDPVELGGKWRNPYGEDAPQWYKDKVKKGLKATK